MAVGSIISTWKHNFLRVASFSTIDAGSEVGYPPEQLVDKLPTSAAMLDSLTGMWLADCGAVRTPSIFAWFNHNFSTVMAVKLRGYTVAPGALTDPADYEIDLPVVPGLEPNFYRQDIWLDLSAVDPVPAYRYWATAITAAGSQNPALGQWWGAEAAGRLNFPFGFEKGADQGPVLKNIRHETYGGVAIKTPQKTRQETWNGTMIAPNSMIVPLMDAWRDVEGSTDPIVFVPDVLSSYAVMGEFMDEQPIRRVRESPHYMRVAIGVRQLSRGLHWNV